MFRGTEQETHSMLPQTEPLETKPVKVTMIKLNICQVCTRLLHGSSQIFNRKTSKSMKDTALGDQRCFHLN